MENLFLDHELEKTAGRGVSLGENANEWPSEILKEAFHQLPYLSDYEVDVVLDRKDDKQGFAFGHLKVANKPDTPITPSMAPAGRDLQTTVAKETKIPVIVKEGEMQALKVMVNEGSFEPLSEGRLGKALFRADVADTLSTSPASQSMVDQLYPPSRSSYFGKTASAGVLEKIGSTMSESVREQTLDRIRNDPAVLYAVEHNDSFAGAVRKIAEATPLTSEQMKLAVTSSVSPDVVQISRGTGFYKVKTASAALFEPVITKLSRDEVVKHFGQETADRVVGEGVITAGRTFTVEDPDVEPQEATSFGRYQVKQADGTWREGWVFPYLVDLDMSVRDMALFTDGYNGTVQEKIAGVPAEGMVFPSGTRPRGTGAFMAASGSEAIATVPVTILNTVKTPDEDYFVAETMEGRKVKLSMVQGLKKIAELEPDHYAIPAEMEFVQVKKGINLAPVKDHHEDARKITSAVTIRSDRTSYSLDGDPLDKVASEHKHFVGREDAEFLLVAMGAHPSRAEAKLAEADLHGLTEISSLRSLSPYEETRAAAIRERVIPRLTAMPNLRVDLLKEAAVIEDDGTADAILALNFINPDNMALFVDNIPEFEKAASHLAELYVASQLGLKDVGEGPILRAMQGMDGVIDGLNSLRTTGELH